jgi:kinetochore protein Spc7/SPC105
MNFNNPEDVYSSSPISGPDSSPASETVSADGSEEDGDDTAMSLVEVDEATGQSIASIGSNGSTSSSDRLDDALRQASVMAGNQKLDFDETGEMSMDMAEDEITNAFKSFAQKNKRDSIGLRKLSSLQDQENINPFAPSSEVKLQEGAEEDQTQDMSMDMTHAIGGIIAQQRDGAQEPAEAVTEHNALKRRRLSTNITSEGSPAKRPARRSSIKRRRSSAMASVADDETMDLTMAVGGIRQQASSRRQSVETSLDDETMDFTMVQGGILGISKPSEEPPHPDEDDISMDLTTTLDKTIKIQQIAAPATPSPAQTRTKTKTPTPKTSPRKSPRKSLAPLAQPSPKLIELEPPQRQYQRRSSDVQVAATPPHKQIQLSAPIQFSPLKETAAKAHSLSDSIKLLSTPRKQFSVSPVKKTTSTPRKATTPKKSATPKKAATPQRTTPRKRVRMEEPVSEPQGPKPAETAEYEAEKIQLQDFLNMTNIRFMDLTTTKRRHTGYPGADRNLAEDFDDLEEETPSLENNVAAAVGTLPVLSMYQHMCHEMKNYISGGRDELRTLEAEVYETQPPLFKEYMSAPADERNIMDNQFKNMKTNARLQSKAGWHAWRAQLLGELKKGLDQSVYEFDRDAEALSGQESVIEASLPQLEAKHDDLAAQAQLLQQRADEESSYDRAELEQARERLVATDTEIAEKQQLLAQLQAELEETEIRIEAVKERKTESLEEIKEAERVREEFRGWSADEVAELKTKVDALEAEHGWSVVSASSSPNTLTMSYLSDLELFLHPGSFGTSTESQPNSPISLSYIGNEEKRTNPQPRPLTTTKRFFLQLLRAHLLSIPQCQVSILGVLRTISSTWKIALAVTEAMRLLSQSCVTNEVILSDERMAVDATLLLASLQTKVRIRFDIAAAAAAGESEETSTTVKADVKVVYGEKYDQPKMSEFLTMWTGGKVGSLEDVAKWVEGVEDLKVRLIKRGKKGERV